MSDLPEDRGPSSLRIIKFDADNPIHEGLMRTRDINQNIDVNPKGHIVMPVAPGMEKDIPRLTEKQVTEKKARVKAEKSRSTAAPKPKKVDAGTIYDKPVIDKQAAMKIDIEKRNAALKAKRKGKTK